MTLRALLVAFTVMPLIVAMAAFFGLATGIPFFVSIRPEFKPMSPVTATCIALLAVAMILSEFRREKWAAILGGMVALLAGAVMASYVLHGADNVSPRWGELILRSAGPLGRTSKSTAVALVLLSLPVVFFRRQRLSDLAATGVLVLASVALLGYAYRVEDLYATSLFNNMALHTAASLFMLAIAAFCLRPRQGWSSVVASTFEAGGATRRQLSFLLVPPVIGWALTRALDNGSVGYGAAMALFVVATVLPLALLVVRDGRAQIALENQRRDKDAQLADTAAQAQIQLKQQAEQLAIESTERAQAEEAMYRAQRLEAVGQLTGGIAHDFNNLLMSISGNVQLLKRKLPPGDPTLRFVDNLASAVSKGSKVTQQLLAFSRTQRLDIAANSIQASVASARELIGSSLGPNINIDVRLSAPNAWALFDPDQLELSLLNLAMNARDAMPQGGDLGIECSVDSADPGPLCALIRVTDSGVGMSPEVAARAAEPFFTTKERGKGTGLGLAQVYGFVMQCQGSFRIASTPGTGTSIELRFPLTERPHEDDPASVADGPEQVDHGRPKKVLVVDDDKGVRGVVTEALSDAGYVVESASDGYSAKAKLHAMEPSVAVIDFLMPGLNGADVAKEARTLYPSLPIIFVSGYSDTMALEGVSNAHVLRKPFDVATLVAIVRAAADPARTADVAEGDRH